MRWPTTRGDRQCVTVTYTAGYGTTRESVPEDTHVAIMMFVAAVWRNPEAMSEYSLAEPPLALRAFLNTCHDERVLEFVN